MGPRDLVYQEKGSYSRALEVLTMAQQDDERVLERMFSFEIEIEDNLQQISSRKTTDAIGAARFACRYIVERQCFQGAFQKRYRLPKYLFEKNKCDENDDGFHGVMVSSERTKKNNRRHHTRKK